MAIISKSAIVSVLANLSAVLASPALLQGRGTCNHDNCLRAIIASNQPPYASSASADCVSFFQETVTNVPVTVSVTNTHTQTADTPTSTAWVTSTVTASTETDVVNVPFTTTDATQELPTTVSTFTSQDTITNTITNVVTQTNTVTVTSTSPTITSFVPKPTAVKRDELQARDTPNAVPAYASACSGTVRYSSACSCVGATHQTVTVTPAPSTSTIDTTVTVTPDVVTVTSTDFVSVTATVVNTVTQTIDATFTHYNPVTATVTIDPTTTSTTVVSTSTTVTSTTTTLPAPTQYCKLNLQVSSTNNDYNQRFIYIKSDILANVLLIAPKTSTSKTQFQLDTAGKLHSLDTPFAGFTVYKDAIPGDNALYAGSNAVSTSFGNTPVNCAINSQTLELTCNSQKFFGGLAHGTDGNYVTLSTTSILFPQTKLIAVPVGCSS